MAWATSLLQAAFGCNIRNKQHCWTLVRGKKFYRRNTSKWRVSDIPAPLFLLFFSLKIKFMPRFLFVSEIRICLALKQLRCVIRRCLAWKLKSNPKVAVVLIPIRTKNNLIKNFYILMISKQYDTSSLPLVYSYFSKHCYQSCLRQIGILFYV